jgi:hypothetical protein
MGGVLLEKHDTPPNESILLNQPLNSSDQGKLIIFAWLMAPSLVLLAGVIPTIFLAFGIYMMKKKQDFSSIDTAVRNFKAYVWLSLIIGVGDSIYWFFNPSNYIFDAIGGFSIWFLISLLGVVIPIIYLNAVNNLFYSPLKKHSEWIAVNGIFSTKPKSATKSAVEPEVDIIKAEKLKQYSVADELMKWGKLKEDGHISEEEFNQAKSKLLKGTEKND